MKEYVFVWKNKCWWLKITSLEQLYDYHEKIESKWSNAFGTLTNSKEFGKGMLHADDLSYSIGMFGANRHMNPIEATMEFRGLVFGNQVRDLAEFGEIYINEKGGYHFKHGDDSYEQFVIRKKFIFPDFKKKEIRIKKFPGGQHFYAYIGDMQVRDGNILKWNTYEEAYKRANEIVTNK